MNFTLHQWHLSDPHFDNVKSGKKIFETRVFDEKRQKIKLGDSIEFTNQTNPSLKPYTKKVIGLKLFKSFKSAIDDCGIRKILPGVKTAIEGVKLYEAFPHKTGTFKTGAKQYGVVRFELADKV